MAYGCHPCYRVHVVHAATFTLDFPRHFLINRAQKEYSADKTARYSKDVQRISGSHSGLALIPATCWFFENYQE
jgi:hypothetical protein